MVMDAKDDLVVFVVDRDDDPADRVVLRGTVGEGLAPHRIRLQTGQQAGNRQATQSVHRTTP
jgi:hypothetical protein